MTLRLISLCLIHMLATAGTALAVGESSNGFPNWEERVLHQLHNRARVDPQLEMSTCPAGSCPDSECYAPAPPLSWSLAFNRAARFHSDQLHRSGCFQHDSPCGVVPDIDDLYPDTCDGSASCACLESSFTCTPCPTCTTNFERCALFGVGAGAKGESLASTTDPELAFNLWLFEPGTTSTCGWTPDHGHRWLIFSSGFGSFGAGTVGITTANYGPAETIEKIPSGTHHPRQAASVDLWANWFDTAGPSRAVANVEGTCIPMVLDRGTAQNGAWRAGATGVASGCHRYYFEFQDSSGITFTYPTSGSLGIGPADSCPDWELARPEACTLSTPVPLFSGWGVALLIAGLGTSWLLARRLKGAGSAVE